MDWHAYLLMNIVSRGMMSEGFSSDVSGLGLNKVRI